MNADLGMDATMAGLAGGIFFFGYLFLQIPGGRRAALGSGKTFIAWSLVSWAVLSVLTEPRHAYEATADAALPARRGRGRDAAGRADDGQPLVSRPRTRRANAMVIMFVPLAGMITAPLSGFILAAYDWHHLFFSAGALSLLCLVVWLMFADDGPETARWVSPREKAYILDALREEQERKRAAGTPAAASFGELLRNPTIWLLIAINFCYQVGIYGYTMWLPTLLKTSRTPGWARSACSRCSRTSRW